MKISKLLKMRMEMARASEMYGKLEDFPSEFEKDLTKKEQNILYDASEIIRTRIWKPRHRTLEDACEKEER